jgi:GT2 family glycosyltransferase
MFTKETSLIIPTRNRLICLEKLLRQLDLYKIKFLEKIVIDSSDIKISPLVKSLARKYSAKYFKTKASTSLQRNYGLKKVIKKTKYIMFLDDDVVFFKDSFNQMDKTIKKNKMISGYGFNQVALIKKDMFEIIKNSNLIKYIHLYSPAPGIVTRGGWHTKILNIKKDIFVDWIYTTACIYKFQDIKNYRFDETFGGYSYLEDLDFSLNLKKNNKRIIISHLAKYIHPENIDRSSFKFGIIEVINRYKIVKKNNLKKNIFFISIFIRFLYSLLISLLKLNFNYFCRAFGNIFGLLLIIFKK